MLGFERPDLHPTASAVQAAIWTAMEGHRQVDLTAKLGISEAAISSA
jgi:hypothetical protein